MTKSNILQKDAPILRETARNIPIKEIGSKKIRNILDDMKKALHAEEDGVAIAAPQIGKSLRIFVVSGKALALAKSRKKIAANKKIEDFIFINPEIIKASKKKKKMEEGCLSVRWLYGQVKRSEKVTIKAYDENGKKIERGASGLLAQIFQHEIDHLNGILFIDKAENVQDMPPSKNLKFVFFGSSRFSIFVLEELEKADYSPILKVTDARAPLPEITDELDHIVVASFGKILPKEFLAIPQHGSLNVHPSLLPKLRGPAPIQNLILGQGEPGVTIIKMDEKMDHGPILAQAKIVIDPWPDHYRVVEEKLGRAGGKLLVKTLASKLEETPQDHSQATYIKLINKEDGLLNLAEPAEKNLRKVLAYSTWPGAYMFFSARGGSANPGSGKRREIRVVIKEAKIENGEFVPVRVIPDGKREMDWQDFLRGH